ncbi:MAG: hypothetical protein AAB506_03170 [Patescibacteria group bacterium]
MRKLLLVLSYTMGSSLLLIISSVLFTALGPKENPIPSYQSYNAIPQVLAAFTESQIIPADARAGIVDSFLKKYHSPFQGLGQFIVDTAIKYQIPYGLIPAIAQCESNVGKTIPNDSFNAWGYGVYGGSTLRFGSWFEAIERVSRGLREDYYDYGLNTPEKIMKKYTPGSNGSWARCVNQFLEELQ